MTTKPWVNYTDAGYDELDGLTGGRWMYDDERMCQVWVQTVTKQPRAANKCKCGTVISRESNHCKPCHVRALVAARPANPNYAIECPKCGVGVGRQCRSAGGHGTAIHAARLAEVADAVA